MKKLLILTAFTFSLFSAAIAQKFAFVDSEYILSKIPEYKEAQTQLDKTSETYQKQIEKKYTEIEELYKTYVKEEILLTDDLKKKREEEILEKEKDVKELEKQKFGVNGELFEKRKELIKPIQDKIYEAIKKIASTNYAIIFDKSGASNILFSNPKYDLSDQVLKKMGYDIN